MSDRITAEELTVALAERGLIPADAASHAAAETANADRPWFIGMTLGIAGWLAGGFTLGFAMMLLEPSNAAEFTLIGIVLLQVAYGLYLLDKEGAFFDQLALALSVAGQFALAAALHEATHSEAGTALLVALMQCVLAVAMPNRVARLLAAVFACIAWALAVWLGLWERELFAGEASVSLGVALMGWSLAWAPVLIAAWISIRHEARWMAGAARRIVRPVLSGLLISLALGTVASEPTQTFGLWRGDEAARLSWVVSWPLLALFAALFAAFCAFRIRNNALLGVAIAGALVHVMHFYFLLAATLLVKSAVMLAMGGVFLAASKVLDRERAEPSR